MKVIPSIDLLNGQCVRLKQGDYQQVTTYPLSPVAQAHAFRDAGARVMHVVDLMGAKEGRITSLSTIADIVRAFEGEVQVGGGIRHDNDLNALFDIGVARAVVGTRALSSCMDDWLNTYGPERLLLALDFKWKENIPYVAVSGWTQETTTSVWDVLARFPSVRYVLCTDIGRDGMQQGPNHGFYQTFVTRYPSIQLQASGGVGTVDDLRLLAHAGVSGAIVGKAIYEGTLSVQEAIACLK